jgi:hypothetical protein
MSETNGQPSAGTPTETTQAGTEGGTNATETTLVGTQDAEETFFDPESIKGTPLEAPYKQMQRAFTEKTTAVKSQKQKIDAFDSFMSNPIVSIRQMASQYGLTIAEATKVAEQAQQEFQPNSWDEVISKSKDEATKELMDKLQPVFSELKEIKKQSIEKTLDEKCPDWRLHEDKMTENLHKHPSLVSDPEMLYRLSVPAEVLQARATKEAIKKFETKAKGAQVSSGSNTNKSGNFTPSGPMSFNEAVQVAKAKLAEQGMQEPRH